MNLLTNRLTDTEDKSMVAKGERAGGEKSSVRLIHTVLYTNKTKIGRICGTLLNVKLGMERRGVWENGYIYHRVPWLFT